MHKIYAKDEKTDLLIQKNSKSKNNINFRKIRSADKSSCFYF